MVQHRIQRTSFPRANREGLGESMRVAECQYLILAIGHFHIVYKLVQESGSKMKCEYIHRLVVTTAVLSRQLVTHAAASLFAITVTGGTVPQLHVIF